ncbi:MAG: aminotransferase class IV [Bacteroidales bacterium]|nr:aminotransferase class IV [Bacteroidales bacterium]
MLINENNCITEGSRSNIFFIKKNELFTSPDEEVLGGITRKYVIDLSKKQSVKIHFQSVSIQELKMFDAVFLTGTSPKVLPVNRIEKTHFDTDNELLLLIMKDYDQAIHDYLVKEDIELH